MGWSSGEIRRHRRCRLHRLAPRRGAAGGRATRSSASTPSPTTTTARARSGTRPGSTCVELDLAEAPLEPILAGVDGVFHLAGQPGVRELRRRLPALRRSGTCSRRSGSSRRPRPRASASSSPPPRPSTATPSATRRRGRAPRPISPYGITKLACEQLARAIGARPRARRGRPALLHRLRPAAAAGHGVHRACSRRSPAASASRSTATASAARSFTYVGDAVAATIAAMERGRGGEVYNVGGGEEATMNEAIALARGRRRRRSTSSGRGRCDRRRRGARRRT